MKFENIDINALLPDAKNPRKDLKPDDPEYQRITSSIKKFGFLEPIIFNTRTKKIIGGHQRLKALKTNGITELNIIKLGGYSWAFTESDLSELTPSEENAANIALNKVEGGWDIDQLMLNIQELKDDDMDITITGFDDEEFESMLKELEDDIPLNEGPSVTPEYHPEFNSSQVTDADIMKSDRELEQITHKQPTYIKAYCPKCGHEFDISG